MIPNGLTHEHAMHLQAAELERTIAMLRSLSEDEWSAQTDCPAWDVRRMYLHVLGACEAGASMRENVRQFVSARRLQRREGGPLEAALSAVQIRSRLDLTPAQIVSRLGSIAAPMVRARTKVPALARRAKIKVDGPVVERWTAGYLIDTIYLRDLWMHRVDACRATGQMISLSVDHDAVIVADVVNEWAHRHAQPCRLTLTGPAGGVFEFGSDPKSVATVPDLDFDAVDFCRTLSGRAAGSDLLATVVPF